MSHSDIVVIAHGRSEMIMAKAVMKALRLQITVFNPYDGKQDVSIGNILDIMDKNGFREEHTIHKKFPDLNYESKGNPHMPDLKIFPVMDIDSYGKMKKSYETGNMFKDYPFSNRIFPIFNDPNLDEVLKELGYKVDTNGSNKVTSYHEIFDNMDDNGFFELYGSMKEYPDMTNLPVFFETCLRMKPKFQGRL